MVARRRKLRRLFRKIPVEGLNHIFRHLRKEIAIGVIALSVFFILTRGQILPDMFGLFVKVLIVACLVVFLDLLGKLYLIWANVWRLMEALEGSPDRSTRPMLAFVLDELEQHVTDQRLLLTRDWMVLDADRLDRLSDISFEHCRGRYIGTDRHVPSEYLNRYRYFLGSQRTDRDAGDDIRMFLYTWDKFEQDMADHPDACRDLMRRQINDDGIRVLRADPDVAETEAKRLELPSMDLGLFGEDFVIFFMPVNNSLKVKVRICPVDRMMRKKLDTYFRRLAGVALQITIDSDRPVQRTRAQEIVDKDVADVSV